MHWTRTVVLTAAVLLTLAPSCSHMQHAEAACTVDAAPAALVDAFDDNATPDARSGSCPSFCDSDVFIDVETLYDGNVPSGCEQCCMIANQDIVGRRLAQVVNVCSEFCGSASGEHALLLASACRHCEVQHPLQADALLCTTKIHALSRYGR